MLARVSGIFGSHLILGNVARQGFGIAGDNETVAALPGGFGSVHAIRLGIGPCAALGANAASGSGSEVDSSCFRRAILGLAPVTVLQSRDNALYVTPFRGGRQARIGEVYTSYVISKT